MKIIWLMLSMMFAACSGFAFMGRYDKLSLAYMIISVVLTNVYLFSTRNNYLVVVEEYEEETYE